MMSSLRKGWRTRAMRTAAVVAVAGAGAAGLSACGSSDESSNAGASASGKKDCPLIGFTNRFVSANAWLATLSKGFEDAGKEAGVCTQVLDANGDIAKQVSQIKTLISLQAKAVVIEPINNTGLAGSIRALKKAGIPIIIVNDSVVEEQAKQVVCNLHDDAFGNAKLVGKSVAESTFERFPGQKTIKFWINSIFPREIASDTREAGFMAGWNEFWKAHPDVKLVRVPNQYGKALPTVDLPIVRNVLVANPDLNAMFNMTDLTADAVITALKQTGRITPSGQSKIIIGGFDGNTKVLKMMMDKPDFGYVSSALNQPQVVGAMALQEAVAAIKGKPPVDCKGSPATRVLAAGVATTKDAKKYYDPKYPNAYDPAIFNKVIADTKAMMESK
jgi:ribose transport system substrate-binding protein